MNPKKHLSTQFDSELNVITSNIMQLAGLTEMQVMIAKDALHHLNVERAQNILDKEIEVNTLESDIQTLLTETIIRRQPAARDLRFLLAVFRIAIDLERIGDEAKKVARNVLVFANQPLINDLPYKRLCISLQLSMDQIKKALDALARLDKQSAIEVLEADEILNEDYKGYLRLLITHMMEAPSGIGLGVDLAILSKGIERMGDHAKNIAQAVIYIIDGDEQ